MKLISQPKQIGRVPFLNAPKRGSVPVNDDLPILQAQVDVLPEQFDALLLTSDLQGIVMHQGQSQLLGCALAENWASQWAGQVGAAVERTGIILAGDLYSDANATQRGASGDVRAVWQSFLLQGFPWVAGVQGNHDHFCAPAQASEYSHQTEARQSAEVRHFEEQSGIHLLDCDVIKQGDLKIGGVGLVMGPPEVFGHREKDEWMMALDMVLEQGPDLLVLHESPHGSADQPGRPVIAERLCKHQQPLLVVCGHVGWPDEPVLSLSELVQVINVDSRAVVITV